jgi:hypothetical protein
MTCNTAAMSPSRSTCFTIAAAARDRGARMRCQNGYMRVVMVRIESPHEAGRENYERVGAHVLCLNSLCDAISSVGADVDIGDAKCKHKRRAGIDEVVFTEPRAVPFSVVRSTCRHIRGQETKSACRGAPRGRGLERGVCP